MTVLRLYLSIECFHFSFFRLANFQQLSPSNSESSFNSMEDFSNGPGNGPHNHEDSDTGMVRYLYKTYCWKKKALIKGF